MLEASGYSSRSLRYEDVARRVTEADLAGFDQVVIGGFFASPAWSRSCSEKMTTWKNTVFFVPGGSRDREDAFRSGPPSGPSFGPCGEGERDRS